MKQDLEYRIATLIGKAATHEQLQSALVAFERAAPKLEANAALFLVNLIDLQGKTINTQVNAFNDECFAIHAEYPVPVDILPSESDGTPVITDFTNETTVKENTI